MVEENGTPAGKLERFCPLNLILTGEIFFCISQIVAGEFSFDFNAVIALVL